MVAVVAGQPWQEKPPDLFIPPDALEVWLESFTGPLDILLYLIRKQNIDIMDIPIVLITEQYMQYIDLMEEGRLSLAADYLVMAAILAEIKSRLLLPVMPSMTESAEEDPRLELVRRLQLYEQFKNAAQALDELPRQDRNLFLPVIDLFQYSLIKPSPVVELNMLSVAMQGLLQRAKHLTHHTIKRETLSVRARMADILARLQQEKMLELTHVFTSDEGRLGLVVSLLAVLELAKQTLIRVTQVEVFAPIYIQRDTHAD